MDMILEVRNATKQFGGLTANENISFDVRRGEIVGIVGPNGAGKTTIFNSISGAHNLSSGAVTFDGHDITRLKAHDICKLGVGRTFQIPQSLNDMTVLENVMVGAMCRHRNMQQVRIHAEESIEICGLSAYSGDTVGNMNVLQKKRIEIARALATEPKLLLLDETMAGLTGTERKDAVELILLLNKRGISILTIEHVMDVVMTVSNRVVVIHTGKMLMEGTPEEVASNQMVIDTYLGVNRRENA